MKRCSFSLGLLLASGFLRAAQPAEPVIRSASEVRRLSPETARKELPVSITAVVTYVNAQAGELFVQDKSAGIFVFIRNSMSDVPLHSGQLVKVEGVTAPGDFASSITRARVTVTGRAEMPKPVVLPFDRILGGKQDSQWGHLVGVIRSGREESGVLYLNAVTAGGQFLIITREYPADWVTTLVDSKVSLDGVLAAVFNEHRQVTGVRIFVPAPRFLHIEEKASASPFDLPQSLALSIGAFGSEQDWSHRIRVRGTITAVATTNLVYLSQGEGNLAVELWMPCGGKPGFLVDLVGFPGTVDGRPGLQSAICRPIAGAMPEQAPEVSAHDIVPPQSAGDGSGLSIAKGTRNDLKLITVAGTVIQVTKGLLAQSLTLLAGNQAFTVTIPDSAAVEYAIEPATQLKITGVCLIAFDEYHRAQSFRLLARKAADIVVVSRPSWLTVRRALLIVAGLAFLIACSVVWILILRRHIAAKTLELQAANECLRKLSVEDPLTGAANRRHFDEVIENEMRRCGSDREPLSLIMLDIDHFKSINDNYGHKRGDRYLIHVVAELRRVLAQFPGPAIEEGRAVVARYGGEEFAVLLPKTPVDMAEAIAETMRVAILDIAIPQPGSSPGLDGTISLGLAMMPSSSDLNPDQFVDAADNALYKAKQDGRNRIVVSDGAVPARPLSSGRIGRAALPLDALSH